MLHELWLQSGTGQRRWEGLPDDVRDTITALFTAKRDDWCGFWSNEDVSVWWNRLCDNVLPEKTMPFDLLTVLPTRLDVEVNGFNGGVMNGVQVKKGYYINPSHIVSIYYEATDAVTVTLSTGEKVSLNREEGLRLELVFDFDNPF